MSDNLKIFLELIADAGKMKTGMGEGERSISGFRKVVSGLSKDIEYATSKIGVLGTAMTTLTSGLVLKKIFSLQDFMPIDDALLRIQDRLKMSGNELDNFKGKLSSLAGEKGIDLGQTFGLAAKMSYAFKPDEITQIIGASDRAAKAMNADLGMVNDRILQIMKIYRLAPKEASGIADALVASRADLESLDVIMQRLILKGGSRKDFSDQLAVIGGLKKAGIESPRVVMQVESVLAMIDRKSQLLQRSGLKLFKIDPASGEKVKKDTVEILTELDALIKKTWKASQSEKRDKRLDELFGMGASEVIPFLISQIDKIKKAKEDQANAAKIASERAATAEKTWGHQLEKIRNHLAGIKTDMSFIFDLAKKPIKFMADSPNLTKGAGYTVAAISAAIMAALAYGKGKEFLKGWGKTGVGVAEGLVLQKATGITPVFVTNWPANGGLPILPGKTTSGQTTKTGGALDTAGDLAIGKVAWDAAKKYGGKALPVIGGVAGSLASMAALLFGGTGLYSAYDALNGGAGENWISDWAQGKIFAQGHWVRDAQGRDYFERQFQPQKPEVKNDIKLSINFDKFGTPFIENNDFGNTSISLERGDYWKAYAR